VIRQSIPNNPWRNSCGKLHKGTCNTATNVFDDTFDAFTASKNAVASATRHGIVLLTTRLVVEMLLENL
jgi:hypothetical protein